MFSMEDLLELKVVNDAQIAPGGSAVLYSVADNGTAKDERSPESRIWLQRLDGSPAEQITFGPHSDRQARWSPEGEAISFLSDRQQRGQAQLYLLGSFPSEARKLTDIPAGVSSHAWSPSGTTIALTAADHMPSQDNDVKLFDSDRTYRRLYLNDVKTGSTTPINHGELHVWEFCWSPDGRQIAAVVSDEPFEWGWYGARLVKIDVESGDVSTMHTPERQIARPEWSPDGSRIALITCRWSDPGMTGGDLITVNVADRTVRNLTEGEPRSHYSAHWRADSSGLVTVGLERARAQICDVDPESGSAPRWSGSVALNDYGGTFDPDSNRFAFAGSTPVRPPEVIIADGDSNPGEIEVRTATETNVLSNFPKTNVEWLSWQSTDGVTIEGLYLSPGDTLSDDPPPMVTIVHGGPTAAAMASFPLAGATAWTPLLLQQGVSVFMPNYRGSNGYGLEFAEANMGDLGGMDLQDVLTGVEHCVGQGLADESRLGVGGWSYGGYLTAWAVTQTSRFGAAVAGAAITNWYSFHGGTNIPGFDGQYIGTAPDELDGPYAWTSPLFHSKDVQTPILFVHGEQDPCCPVGQAYEMTRSLRLRGVEAECAIYPREGHGFIEKAHRKDMVERSVGWFQQHLGGL
jgi:dipeptidyl aminopeptidase/acylaminoacyl peptidase